MSKKKGNIFKIIVATIALLLLTVVSVYTYMYIKEKPGGLADQTLSKAMGLDETMSIPIGNTPEDAVQQFRNATPNVRAVHQEPVDDGMILFTQRSNSEASSNMQLEYVRKNSFGWKWVWGGGYGIGDIDPSEYALYYMNLPKLEGIDTLFPMVFGTVEHPGIQRVTAETEQNGSMSITEAKLIRTDVEEYVWFVMLPSPEGTPYTIKIYDEEGKQIGSKQSEMVNDSGSLTLGKRSASM
ncbi:hypothetical protein Q9R46_09080 [Paenibacillus sp. RRE4]|uniref:hypothetical protein n=1 Tax=Paenibacillus sp. RRE4 TaxID=2962587 RepID=UPI002880FD1E|nr:hypothetical protein [Paenibacillus sp. RRE4]MDT0122793.1 hypothetical protein [Paenibacillus sp. RRE4]